MTDLDFHDAKALARIVLDTASLEKPVRIRFLVGSGLTLPVGGKPGVPGAAEMVSRVRAVLSERDRAEFDKRVSAAEQPYQAAFAFISNNVEQANRVIREAVLSARLPTAGRESPPRPLIENTDVAEMEQDVNSWYLREGTEHIGRLLRDCPGVFDSEVITTNFDPLIEVSLRRAGFTVHNTAVGPHNVPERSLSPVDAPAYVVHLHGHWHGSDTQHTASHLGFRKNVHHWLLKCLEQTDLLVMGYGGWDDCVMRAVDEVIDSPVLSRGMRSIHWCFYDDDVSVIEKKYPKVLAAAALARTRFHLYKGINPDKVLPALHAELSKEPRVVAHGAPRGRRAPEEPVGSSHRFLVHRALRAVSLAQRRIGVENFAMKLSDGRVVPASGGWTQDIKSRSGAPSVTATAQALMVLEGFRGPPPPLVAVLVRGLLEEQVSPCGGWTIGEVYDIALVRTTALVLTAAVRSRLTLSVDRMASALRWLLSVQKEATGGWGFAGDLPADVVSSAQAAVAINRAVTFRSEVLGALAVRGEHGWFIEQRVANALERAADYLVSMQSHGVRNRGMFSLQDKAELAEELATTCEALFGLRALRDSQWVSHQMRTRLAVAVERAAGWISERVQELEPEALARMFHKELHEVRERKAKVKWGHATPEVAPPALVAAGAHLERRDVKKLVEVVLQEQDEGLWSSDAFPNTLPVWSTYYAVEALRAFAGRAVEADGSLLLEGPHMAAIDASHYGMFHVGLFGIAMRPSSPRSESEPGVVRHQLPFALPLDDLHPKGGDKQQEVRARAVVDAVSRSLLESMRAMLSDLERPDGAIFSGAIAVLRGGAALIGPFRDIFPGCPLGLVRASRTEGKDRPKVEWVVPPKLSGDGPLLLLDLIINTGDTLAAVVDTILEGGALGGRKVMVAAPFAHESGVRRLKEHPSIEALHLAWASEERDPNGWIKGLGFDAGDLILGSGT